MPTYTPDEFADILQGAPVDAVKDIVMSVSKGALNVKNDARASVQRTAPVHNAHAYSAINYDTGSSGSTVFAEIGYDKSQKPGRIGNLLEFGGGGDHSPPHHDLRLAMEAEDPKFTDAVGDAGLRAIK